jgi:hypothetical protein
MLRLGGSRQPVGVGGHKGEGEVGITAIFCQIEEDATNQIPGGVQTLEKGLEVGAIRRGFHRRGDVVPQASQDIGAQILGPRHHRRR